MIEPTCTPLDRLLALDRRLQAEERIKERRKDLLGAAYWAVIGNREERVRVRESLRANKGVWWDEMAPLTPTERTALITQLRTVLGLPADPRQRPTEGAPRLDVPHLGRPE